MATVLTAFTTHGTVLSVGAADRRMRHGPGSELGALTLPLFLLTGGDLGTRCIPFAIDPVSFRPVLPTPLSPGSGVLFYASQADEPGTLRGIATNRYLSAVPDGTLQADRLRASAWEQFSFAPASPAGLGQALDRFAGWATTMFAASSSWTGILTALLESPPSELTATMIEAVWPLLTLAEFDRVALQLRHDPRLAGRLSEIFPRDFYAVTALPALLRWLGEQDASQTPAAATVQEPPQPARQTLWSTPWRWRDANPPAPAADRPAPTAPAIIGPTLDRLARDGYDGALASFAHACNASLRARVTPTRGAAIVATARSEGVYLLEWIAHHRLLGVEAIFLYTNNNDDGSDALLAALHDAGVITWTRSEMANGVSAQNKAYGHALNVCRPLLEHRWALFIDLDEFLVLNPVRYRTMAEFMRWHEMRDTDAVGINWVMVGSSAQSAWTDAPLSRRNTNLLNEPNAHIKVMMKPRHFIQAHPHFPFADSRRSYVFRLASGALHHHRKQPHDNYHARAFTDDPSDADACLYHFNFKSVEEFAWKVSRNRGDFPLSQSVNFEGLDHVAVGSFVGQHRSQDVTVDDRLARGLSALDDEIERLRGLPGVAEAERSTKAAFRQRLDMVKSRLLADPRLGNLGAAGAEMRALLQATLS